MHTSASVGERKFAEKLTILVERGQGILTRVYNIKKVRCQQLTHPTEQKKVWFLQMGRGVAFILREKAQEQHSFTFIDYTF